MWLASGGGDGTIAVRSLEFLKKVVTMKVQECEMITS